LDPHNNYVLNWWKSTAFEVVSINFGRGTQF